MTTVGYGDVVPQTELGRLLASVVMLLGFGIIALPTRILTISGAKNKACNIKLFLIGIAAKKKIGFMRCIVISVAKNLVGADSVSVD